MVMIRKNQNIMKKWIAIVCLALIGFLPAFGAGAGDAMRPAVQHPAAAHSSNKSSLRAHRRKHRRHVRRHRRHARRWLRRHRRQQLPMAK
jgi:hypothetical protein